jgi:hypothetical protein
MEVQVEILGINKVASSMWTSPVQPQVAKWRGDLVPDSEEGLKLIFLDVDGVLVLGPGESIVSFLLTNLKTVVQATGAKLVLSSDWRRYRRNIEVLRQSLQLHGMDIIGCTPQLSPHVPQRPAELLQWIHDYRSHGGQIGAWIAIDDRDLLVEKQGNQLEGHFVRTNPKIGLDGNVAHKSIQLLQSQSTVDGFKIRANTSASPVPTNGTPVSPVTSVSTPVPGKKILGKTTEPISLTKEIPSEFSFAEQETMLEGDEKKTMLAGKGLKETTRAAGTRVAAAMKIQTVNPLGDALQHSVDGGMISNALAGADSARDFHKITARADTVMSIRSLVTSKCLGEANATRPDSVPDAFVAIRNRRVARNQIASNQIDRYIESHRACKRVDRLASEMKMPSLVVPSSSPTSVVGTSKTPSSSPPSCLPVTPSESGTQKCGVIANVSTPNLLANGSQGMHFSSHTTLRLFRPWE